jgi:hypothetical protein
MPAKYSHAILAVGLVLAIAAQAYAGELSGFLFFVLSPLLLLSLAAAITKRNIVIRLGVVLGALFLLMDILAFVSMTGANSTAPIAFGVVVILQLVLAVALLLAALVAGRVNLRRGPDGTV